MIFHLSGPWAIAVDIAVWLVIHLGVVMVTARMRPDFFNPESWLYRQRTWERGGKIYKSLLKVKKWKRLLPDGAAVFKGGFRKKHLGRADAAYIRRFILETCRAEFTHWVIFLFALIFFLWNDWWIGLIMVAYGLATNMPCIVTQRYNRIRLKRVYKRCASEGEERAVYRVTSA
jgi:glycosyl-4,4'-diaponeurosporenoate acyltransferase